MHPGAAYARKGAIGGALAGGLGGAALGAATGGLPKHKHHLLSDKKEERSKKERIVGAVTGGLLGGAYGASAGRTAGWNHRARKWNSGFRPATAMPPWLKGAKTKAEAKSLYKAQARKHHPDLGGDPSKFRKLLEEWDMHEPNFKTAMLTAFADEIEKIANAGAMAGGALGYYLAPSSIKGKVIGTAAGALGGQLIGGAIGAAKRTFYDQPRAYQQSQLYGYQPSMNPEPGSPTRFGY